MKKAPNTPKVPKIMYDFKKRALEGIKKQKQNKPKKTK